MTYICFNLEPRCDVEGTKADFMPGALFASLTYCDEEIKMQEARTPHPRTYDYFTNSNCRFDHSGTEKYDTQSKLLPKHN